jgi:hypothetical protein
LAQAALLIKSSDPTDQSNGSGITHYGTFDTKQEAALAYDRAARQHGEGKMKLNYESIEAAEEAATQAQAEHTLMHHVCADPKKPSRKRPRMDISIDAPRFTSVKSHAASGFYGVVAIRKRWQAKINYGGKHHHLGTFDTKQEAALAHDRAAREHGGGKTQLNYASIEAAEEAAAHAQVKHTLVHGPKKPRHPSGFHGVHAHRKRWQAKICYGSKLHHIGTFDTKQEAALAYDRAAREHGEGKKKLNYESIEAGEEAAAQAEAEHTLLHDLCADPKPRQPSGFHGVIARGKRWQVQIFYGGKKHHLGTFDTKQEAALAYDRAAREHGGGKMKLNYESIKAAEEAAANAQPEHILVHGSCVELKKPRQPSGFHGVSANGKRWRAEIYYGKKHHIGTFDTKQEAALAYDREAREHGGGKKKLNYESIKAAEEAAAHAQAGLFADALCAGPHQPRPRRTQ